MEKVDKITKDNIKENYEFLTKKINEDRAKNYSTIILSFRNEILRQKFPLSPMDMANLDILYFEALKIDGKTYLGRKAVEEAYSIIAKIDASIEDKLVLYKNLAYDFQILEDVRKELKCFSEASYFATKLGRKDEAIALKKDVISLAKRFPEEEKNQYMPSFEELILQFGKEDGKNLYLLEEEEPIIIFDPVETNPFYIRLIDKVNEKIDNYFIQNKEEFSEQKFNFLKRKYLKEEGLEWTPPYKNNKA